MKSQRPSASAFPLLDEYLGCHLDVDLAALTPRRTAVVESARRLRREESYGFPRPVVGVAGRWTLGR